MAVARGRQRNIEGWVERKRAGTQAAEAARRAAAAVPSGRPDTVGAGPVLLQAAGAARVRTAACVLNEINWRPSSGCDPGGALTYIGASCRGWVVFPWETR